MYVKHNQLASGELFSETGGRFVSVVASWVVGMLPLKVEGGVEAGGQVMRCRVWRADG